MNFTKEQIDYVKKALDHIDFLTGSSRNSKTKQIIEELQQENARLKDKIENATNFVDKYMDEWDFQDEVWQDMNDLLILLKEN